MKILNILLLLLNIAQATTIEEKFKYIAILDIKDGSIELKMNGQILYQKGESNDLIQTKAGQVIVLEKGFSKASFVIRDYSLTLFLKNKEKLTYLLVEKLVNGATGKLTEHHIQFRILNDKIVTTSKERIYTEKELSDKIRNERAILEQNALSENIEKKIANIASDVTIKKGNIILTLKNNDFEYLQSVNGNSTFRSVKSGQKIIIGKEVNYASFQSENYALSFIKQSKSHYLLEELKSAETAENTIKTVLNFKVIDDKFELVTDKDTANFEKATHSNWLIWGTLGLLGFTGLLFLVLYKRLKTN